MKKQLLLLFAFLCSMGMWAEEETLTLSTAAGIAEITVNSSGTSGSGGTMSISKGSVTVSSAKGYFAGSGTNGVQIYGGGSMTVSVPSTKQITKIVMTLAGSCYPFVETPDATLSLKDNKTDGQQDATYTITPAVQTITFTNNAGGQTKVKKLIVTYEDSGVANVPVTGVSLNNTSLSVTEGEQFSLVATVAPTNATNKGVTWTSSTPSVATVVGGLVTAVAPGTTTITVKTNDGNYTANCSVTVNAFVQPDFATITFAPNSSDTDGSGWSKSNAISDIFSEGSMYISSVTTISNVSPARNSLVAGAKFGSSKNAGQVTFDLAHPLNVSKIIVTAAPYGASEGQEGFTLNDVNVPMTNGENKVYEDYEVDISGSVSSIDLKCQAGKRIYVKSISFVKTGAPTTVAVNVNNCGNASFSCASNLDFTDVANVKAYMVTNETAENVTLTQINKVPANTGIFVIGDGGNYNIPILYGTCTDDASKNKLIATTTAYNVTGSDNVWALSKTDGLLHPVTSGTIAAGKAYLVSAVGGSARALVLDNESTGIQSVQNTVQNGVAYNLAGQRVAANAKGLVIINGKKYLNK